MRRLLRNFALMATAAVSVVSCSEADINDRIEVEIESKKLVLNATTPPTSKVGFTDNGEAGIAVAWEAGDSFTLYDSTGQEVDTFTTEKGDGSFTSSLDDLTLDVDAEYTAKYNEEATLDSQNGDQIASLDDACQMEATFNYDPEGVINFKHTNAVIAFKFTCESRPDKLILENGDETYTVTYSTLQAVDGVYTSYIMINPCVEGERLLKISLYIDGATEPYEVRKISAKKAYEVGKYYSFPVASYYVKVGATGDGSSWAEAMNLSEAIANANVGDVIHVAAGTYTPSKGLSGTTEARDFTFELKSNITVIGGYPSDAAQGAVSDPKTNVTTLDANGAYHAVAITAARKAGEVVTLQGLTITGGVANNAEKTVINGASFQRNYGGGLIVGNSETKLIDCKITNNTAAMAGGVHVFEGSKATFEQCEISNNEATGNCAGICNWESTVTINNSLISNNSATGVAGGIYSYLTSRTELYNSTISGNSAIIRGAGYFIREGSTAIIANSTFNGNAANTGGAIAILETAAKSTKADIINCTIVNNEAKTSCDGGVLILANTETNIYNTIVSGNRSKSGAKDISATLRPKVLQNSIEGSKVYNDLGDVDDTQSFDYATMIEQELTDNGGYFKTLKLLGTDNPATSNGMSYSALQTLGEKYSPIIPIDIIGKDQTGASRDGKTAMGACVK